MEQEDLNNLVRIEKSADYCLIFLSDTVTNKENKYLEKLLNPKNEIYNFKRITLDLNFVSRYDSYIVIFLRRIKKLCSEKSIHFETKCNNQQLLDFIKIYDINYYEPAQEQEAHSFFKSYISNIGNFSLIVINDFKLYVEYLGELFIKLFSIAIKPLEVRWKDFPLHFTNNGVNALPIVLLILFLIGLISGYQGAIQLEQFGADVFLADLIGISITRELGPLMTAIIIAGRSGSSFTAEIGTMKVSEEIDSLKTMGFDITNFLVLPRVLAVTLAMPFLTILANLAGIIGGLVSGLAVLNITMTGYINQLQSVLGLDDIFSGLIKSMVFGFLVASVGCFRGLQVKGGAESVGKNTTISVVNGILLIILSDALLTFLFQILGI